MKGLIFFILLCTLAPLHAATIAHYKFESSDVNAPLYELTDSSGRSHHGRVLGQEPFELTTDVPPFPGLSTTALDLRGRLDYAVIPHHSDFAPTGSWTIEFFIKPALFHQEHGGETNIAGPFSEYINTNVAYTVMYKQNTNEVTKYGYAWAFHYLPARGWVVFTIRYGASDGQTMLVGKDLRDGKWHHVAVVFGTSIENELRLFIDGQNAGSANQHGGNIPISWGTGPIFVGALAREDSQFLVKDRNFDGMLDEIRFSDTALDQSTFLVDYIPIVYAPIPTEVYSAVEIEFQADAGQTYRIEQRTAAGNWQTLGYLLGEGAVKSFFHRRDQTAPSTYRVLQADTSAAIEPTSHDAVEVRFPTEHDQLYTINRFEQMPGESLEQTFILGDGAKFSHFERASTDTSFFKVERY
jgi:hypothetical protein